MVAYLVQVFVERRLIYGRLTHIQDLQRLPMLQKHSALAPHAHNPKEQKGDQLTCDCPGFTTEIPWP